MHESELPDIAAQRYASGFARMFWAFLFLGISFRLTWTLGRQQFMIDLLPDFIGYLLIAAGANRLLGLHANARGNRNLAMVLTFLALPAAVRYRIGLGQPGHATYCVTAPYPLPIITSILDILLELAPPFLRRFRNKRRANLRDQFLPSYAPKSQLA